MSKDQQTIFNSVNRGALQRGQRTGLGFAPAAPAANDDSDGDAAMTAANSASAASSASADGKALPTAEQLAEETKAMPPGWEVRWSSREQRRYYHDIKNRRTIWEKPTKPAVAPQQSHQQHHGALPHVSQVVVGVIRTSFAAQAGAKHPRDVSSAPAGHSSADPSKRPRTDAGSSGSGNASKGKPEAKAPDNRWLLDAIPDNESEQQRSALASARCCSSIVCARCRRERRYKEVDLMGRHIYKVNVTQQPRCIPTV